MTVFEMRRGYVQRLSLNLPEQTVYTNAPFRLPKETDALLPVTYRVTAGPARLEGNLLRLTGPGTVELIAQQAGDEEYLSLAQTNRIQVKANQSIIWDKQTAQYILLNEPYPLLATASSGLPVTFRVLAGPALIEGSFLTITNIASIPVAIAAQQAGSDIYCAISSNRSFNRPLVKVVSTGIFTHSAGSGIAVQIAGNHAYLAEGKAGLRIFDLSSPAEPHEVGRFDTPGSANSVRIVGELAFVADGLAGVQILNVANPANPILVGSFDTAGVAEELEISGQFAFVADYDAGLAILDISNPAQPKLRAQIKTPDRAVGVAVAGHLAYVADARGGLRVLDVSDPSQPAFIGQFETGGIDGENNAVEGFASRVRVNGSVAYLVDGRRGLIILDVSNPATPVQIGSLGAGQPISDVRVVGSVAYLAAVTAGVEAWNVENPAAPVRLGRYDTRGSATGLAVAGSRVSVADQEGGLQIIDFAQPDQPRWVGSGGGIGFARRLQAVGKHVFVANGPAGLQVLDASNPTNLVVVANRGTPGNALDLEVIDELAFVADGPGGLQILDVANPTNPVRLGSYRTAQDALSVRISGSLAYVAEGEGGIEIIDVSRPASPTRVSGYDTPGSALSVKLAGNHAYVADGPNGLVILNVSIPAAPTFVARNFLFGAVTDVAIEGDSAIVLIGLKASAWFGNRINLHDPATTTLAVPIDSYYGQATSLQVSGGRLFLNSGSKVFGYLTGAEDSYQDPSFALLFSGTRAVEGLTSLGDKLFLAEGTNGVEVVTIQTKLRQSIRFQMPREIAFTNGLIPIVATASSGLPVTFQLVPGSAAILTNGALKLQGTGYAYIGADQAGDITYEPAASNAFISITNNQDIALLSPTNTALEFNVPHPVSAVASSGLPVKLEVSRGPAQIVDGKLIISGFGEVDVTATQAGTTNSVGLREFLPVTMTRTFNRWESRFTLVGQLPANLTSFWGITVAGNRTYLASTGNGLSIIDTQDPALPRRVGAYRDGSAFLRVAVEGSIAYLAADGSGLTVVDVADAENPRFLSNLDLDGYVKSLKVVGRLAYLANGTAGAMIVDVSNPSAPTLLGRVSVPGYASAIDVRGHFAYVAGNGAGVTVLDVQNPAAPTVITTFDIGGPATDVVVDGNFAYVTDFERGLVIFNVVNPRQPTRLGSAGPGSANRLKIQGSKAYLANDALGVSILDVSNPAQPKLLASYDTPGAARDLAVVGDLVYVTGFGGGLTVLDFRDRLLQAVAVTVTNQLPFTEAPLPLTAYASSGLPVSFRLESGPGRVVGTDLIATNAGYFSIMATQPGNDWLAATETRFSLFVAPLPQTLSLAPAAGPWAVSPFRPTTVNATSSAGLPVTLTLSSGPASLEGNQLTVFAGGTVNLRAASAGNERFYPAETNFTYTLTYAPEVEATLGRQSFTLHPSVGTDGLPLAFTTQVEGQEAPWSNGGNGQIVGSGEVRPVARPQPAWVSAFRRGGESGTFWFTDRPPDRDGNGRPDFLEARHPVDLNLEVNLQATGAVSAPVPAALLHLTRAAEQTVGDYELNLPGSVTYVGRWSIVEFRGLGRYDRTQRTLQVELARPAGAGAPVVMQADLEYAPADNDALGVGGFRLSPVGNPGTAFPLEFAATKLPWVGGRQSFSGPIRALDGDPATAGPDYVDHWLSLYAPLDEDLDRSPDLVDLTLSQSLRPVLPASANVRYASAELRAQSGNEVILESSTDLRQWAEYRRFVGAGLEVPVPVSLPPGPGTSVRFWRIRSP